MITAFLKNPIYKKYRNLLISLLDLVIVAAAYFLSFIIVSLNFRMVMPKDVSFALLLGGLLVTLVIYMASFLVFRIYKSLWKYTGPVEVLYIVMAVCTAVVVSLLVRPLIPLPVLELRVIVVTGLLSILLMCNTRLGYRLLRRRESALAKTRNALIIGAGDGGYLLCKEIMQNPAIDANVVGFVDDAKRGMTIYGKKVLCDSEHMDEVVREHDVELAFIAIPSASKKEIQRIYGECSRLHLETKIMRINDVLEEKETDEIKRYPVEDISIEDLLGRGEIHLDQEEIRSYISGKVVAVTGAGGSIGSELCRQIVRFQPKELVMIDINENALYMLEQEFNRDRVHGKLSEQIRMDSYIASIRDRVAIDSIFADRRPDVVYHAAAHKHVPLMETRPMEAVKNNVFGTNNVMQSCVKHQVSRFILISTDKAVNPTNVMGATKRMTEMLLQANGDNGVTKMAAVRFGNVLGSNGSVIPIFKKQIQEGGPVTITDKEIIRYFMTIPEAAQLVLQAGYYADKGEIFVLDMGEPVKILDLAEKMIRMSGYEPYKEIDIVEIGLRPGEKMFEELRLDGEDTKRTKNDLIFVNQVMGISHEQMDQKLAVLSRLLANNASKEEFRETMLSLIREPASVAAIN